MRAHIAATALVALIASASCDGSGGDGGDDATTALPEVDRELLPTEELASLAGALSDAADADLMLCPGYAEPARRALRELAGDARAVAEGMTPAGAAEAADDFADGAAGAAVALAGLNPDLAPAARRHRELTAAVRDLADGFSALSEALSGGGRGAAALARTENGLANVEVAADAVIASCR